MLIVLLVVGYNSDVIYELTQSMLALSTKTSYRLPTCKAISGLEIFMMPGNRVNKYMKISCGIYSRFEFIPQRIYIIFFG